MGPTRNQRLAPLAATPSDGTNTITSNTSMHMRMGIESFLQSW